MELFGIPAATLVQGGLGSLGVLCFLMVVTGRLVPVRQVDRELARADKRHEDLLSGYQTMSAAQTELAKQLGEVLAAIRPLRHRDET